MNGVTAIPPTCLHGMNLEIFEDKCKGGSYCASKVPTTDLSSGRNLFAQFLGQQNNIVIIKAKLAPSTSSDTSTVDLRGTKWAVHF